jgi:hypothetical protein
MNCFDKQFAIDRLSPLFHGTFDKLGSNQNWSILAIQLIRRLTLFRLMLFRTNSGNRNLFEFDFDSESGQRRSSRSLSIKRRHLNGRITITVTFFQILCQFGLLKQPPFNCKQTKHTSKYTKLICYNIPSRPVSTRQSDRIPKVLVNAFVVFPFTSIWPLNHFLFQNPTAEHTNNLPHASRTGNIASRESDDGSKAKWRQSDVVW